LISVGLPLPCGAKCVHKQCHLESVSGHIDIAMSIADLSTLLYCGARWSDDKILLRYLFCCGYAGSSLEVKIETDSNDAMEIKTEADSNDIMECAHHHHQTSGMSGLYDDIFFAFVCLCMDFMVFTMFEICIMSTVSVLCYELKL